ncbi:spermine oxidase-like isoform X2 [Bradysia coprophila]|uniref:spermine oxidase-like isoform X2 n=1 Tax=Bradysia coprophila TaxID=38358 RepID=UPI00187DB44E|nr:spermine oxidase-like isoform X2 [Bradysia coprophila]
MCPLITITLLFAILNSYLVVGDDKSTKFIIVGAGASGISAAAKLLENGYNNVVVLEALDRIGGRVHSIPFGKGFVDLGAQWCQGEQGNVVYELVKDHFEFGDIGIGSNTTHAYTSDGQLVDLSKYVKLMDLSETITSDYENMAKFNGSLGEFFDINFPNRVKELGDIDEELVEQIKDLSQRQMNSLYSSESWFDISSLLSGDENGAGGNQQLTWKEHGSKIVFDFLMKKRPDPSKTLPVDEKIQFNKEVTNINWTSNEVVVDCADGSEYRADHVIVTVSLGFLKKHHRTLFTPQLPEKKINAIEHTGYGTLGKFFLEFQEPFWPKDDGNWTTYTFLWKQEDKDKLIGTEREWVTDIFGVIKEDAQPNLLGGLLAGKHIRQFETISDEQLIDDSVWLLQKFLGRPIPRPINMRRNRWQSNKYFFGTYSFGSMDTQAHNVALGTDLAETLYSSSNKPVVLIAGEATEKDHSGYVHGAVMSGWRAANEISDYYKSIP